MCGLDELHCEFLYRKDSETSSPVPNLIINICIFVKLFVEGEINSITAVGSSPRLTLIIITIIILRLLKFITNQPSQPSTNETPHSKLNTD